MRFDLTFNGQVLEDYDAGDVRQALADLLDFDDDKTGALFTGNTVVLGQRLGRKPAAELFSRLTGIGARVELVRSGTAPADARVIDTALARQLEKDGDAADKDTPREPVEETEEGPSKIWPVSAARRPPATHKSDPNDDSASRQEPGVAQKSVLDAARRGMQALQREMEQTKLLARRESEKLQHRLDHFERVAERELAELEDQEASIGDRCSVEIEALDEKALQLREQTEATLADLSTKIRETTLQTKAETDRLHGLLLATEDGERASLQQLDQARSDIRERTDAEIQALRARIEALESGAADQVAALEQEAQGNIDQWRREREDLEGKQRAIAQQADERLGTLQEQQQHASSELDAALNDIDMQRDAVRQQREEALAALAEASDQINLNLASNVARAQRADERARERSKATLQNLHAQKLELQRRATAAMERAGAATIMDAESEAG